MRKREAGQAFVLVLILLAIGALVVIPALRLTTTVLKSNQAITQRNKGLYACEAAQEKIMWMLYNDIDGIVSENLTADGDTISFTVDVCGTTVYAGITMRATEGQGGITLAADHVIKPTKTVTPSHHLDWDYKTYTYEITLEQLSDNNTQGLDAIYDIPPGGFGAGAYDEEYGSWLSLDGGDNWLRIPDPHWDHAKGYLKWPADYEWDPVVTNTFSSDPLDANYFHGIRDFDVREVKKLRFKMYGRLDNSKVHCNWVVLKPWDTLSGPQAPITVGLDEPGECAGGGGLEVDKTSYPEIIQPGVPTVVDYTISVTNMATSTQSIQRIIDYLPPEFEYIEGSVDNVTSTLTNLEPIDPWGEEVNGVLRERVEWTQEQFPGGNDVSIASEETLTISFQALATKDVSGTYYNEVLIFLKDTGLPGSAFDEAGVSPAEYGTGYSWNTGMVVVPAYDSSTGAEGENITANIGFELDQVRIISWHAK